MERSKPDFETSRSQTVAVAGIAAFPGLETAWLGRHWQKLLAALLWLLVIGIYGWYMWSQAIGPLTAVQQLLALMQDSAYGPLIYIGLYAIRPLLFFSATLLTLAGGFLFGPVWGIVLTLAAANLSAMVAYAVGRYFGQGLLGSSSDGLLQRYAQRMRKNSFETVLIMRFVFLPYDFVSYVGGILRADWRAFLLATALGCLPGTISFVLFGASIESFDGGLPALNWWVLGLSILIFGVSFGLSRYFKRREAAADETAL